MNNTNTYATEHLLVESYGKYFELVKKYIAYRINYKYQAEDLAQDVFIRLLDYRQMLRPDTVKYFIFAIARNITTDYIRRYYKKQEIDIYLYESSFAYSNETEEYILAKDLQQQEKQRLRLFPKQRRVVYSLSRYQEKTIPEISSKLNLSRRTVENHLFLGRKIMREFMKMVQ